METFEKLFARFLVFVYHCFDRIVIQGYLPLLHKIFEHSCEMGRFRLTANKVAHIFGTRVTKRLKGNAGSVLEKRSTAYSKNSTMAITSCASTAGNWGAECTRSSAPSCASRSV
jgi:hypothetical protein